MMLFAHVYSIFLCHQNIPIITIASVIYWLEEKTTTKLREKKKGLTDTLLKFAKKEWNNFGFKPLLRT